MTPDEIIFNLLSRLPFILIKIFTIILLLMHVLFSVIILRQTRIMSKIVEAQISPTIYLISIIHLLISISVLIWAFLFFFFLPV